jgi:hypothetical protein
MKIIITEEQSKSIKKIRVLEKYIDYILSDYDWYEGIDKLSVETFKFRAPIAYEVPFYRFYIKTNDYAQSYHDADSDNSSITSDIDDMFMSLFPRNKDGKWGAVWVFNYVDV